MTIPLIDLRAQYLTIRTELVRAVEEVLDSGIYVAGRQVNLFEKEAARLTLSKYAVSTANGTDSLVLALHACGVEPGDEIITSPYTFFATAEAIARVGAVPVFADIDRKTYNLSPDHAEAQITSKTKAILPVHLFGQPADMDAFLCIAQRYHIDVIEDACQAFGAHYKGTPVGSIGRVGCVSFFPTKNLGGYGDGGIIFTDDEHVARQVRLLASHGSTERYYHEAIGYNSRLDEIQAAMLRIKLRKLEEWNRLRQKKATVYKELLQDTGITLPYTIPEVRHVYHIYLTECEKRDELASYLQQRGVATGHYYPCALHLQKACAYLGYRPGDFPAAEELSRYALALPMFPELTLAQQQYISHLIHQFMR
ncbi:DegT/DnrJ/EryC1/StrS family aminotransferase [Paenibacillus xerothermodurans]|uniref:DegT/DnrJ/EryC1/StrS family aminotransferase n=1 Tax=Paenibacillus xerothermodurans TaxID=1977292 RepID=A0A2W1P071_PAEXE|nr:DegT/DnrJ/EryC1/StrS family aminotransferase [Paenibacillus xerothermodurans]PZE21132.1 DegT/DnrJ/EryC1/StrS family aminotransferase [Paenibacillus xerothermodurans]